MNNIRGNSIYSELFHLDKKIFGREPWNKGYKCENCGKIFSIKFMNKCNCGKSKLKPFYDNREGLKKFKDDGKRDQYHHNIIYNIEGIKRKIIGFTKGWSQNIYTLNSLKLGLNNLEYNKLINNILKKYPNFTDKEKIFYSATALVDSDYRGKGLYKKLKLKQEKYVKTKGNIKYIFLRTTQNADMPKLFLEKHGYQIVYKYKNDPFNRILLIKKL